MTRRTPRFASVEVDGRRLRLTNLDKTETLAARLPGRVVARKALPD